MEIKNILYEVVFTIYNITRYSYLDICVKGKTTYQVVSALEYIHDKIIGSDIERDYIMIVSYDSVSEYYCNKAYPKLNKLERNLRKLLFSTYTVNFGVDYYQKTVPPDLQKKIERRNTRVNIAQLINLLSYPKGALLQTIIQKYKQEVVLLNYQRKKKSL